MITIPCDYSEYNSAVCDKGTVLIYGELPVPPRYIECPQCKGTGKIKVTKQFIKDKIKDLTEEKALIDEELDQWYKYLG